MRLVLATLAFSLNGTPYPGFPIVLNEREEIVEIAFEYLIYACIERGRLRSRKSWRAIGQHLYDYFGFLEGHNLAWDALPVPGQLAPIVAYRDWSLTHVKLKPNTINDRLRTAIRFYRWAHRRRRIAALPFDIEIVWIRKPAGFLQDADASGGKASTADVLLSERKEPIKVLSRAQIRELLAATNPTHRLIIRLGLQTGLRAEELLTFPLSHVFNPDARRTRSAKINVLLDPLQMKVKGDKPRVIHVPTMLMGDLWEYAVKVRPGLAQNAQESAATLFITQDGRPYGEQGQLMMFRRLSRRLGFQVTAHMLRHAYATHTLHALRERRVSFDPLLYVRDRLGHSSVCTTERYLHYLADIEDDLMTRYQEEIDAVLKDLA